MGSVVARSDATIPGAMLDPLEELLVNLVGARQVALTTNQGDNDTPARHDGGLHAAFDSTIIRVLNRIDSIVDTPRLWKPDKSTARTLTVADLTNRLKRASIMAEGQRPSARLASKLSLSVQGGRAVVILEVPGGAVVGVGDSFGEAMEDFDRKFTEVKPVVAEETPASAQ